MPQIPVIKASNTPPLQAANGRLLNIDGVILAEVTCEEYGVSYSAELLVTPDLKKDFLISMHDMASLGLLGEKWPRKVCAAQPASTAASLPEVLSKFSDILVDDLEEARGGMKGSKMHIELKPEAEVKPVQIYTTRQVPLHYRAAYRKLIKELLALGIISREDKPTTWTSRAHFVPKPGLDKDGNPRLRLVTDYRELNKAVLRPTHPFPSASDLMLSLIHI